MQLKQIPRDALLKPLQAVSGIVERRHTLPILANVLLEQKNGRLFVTATDLEMQITAHSELAGKEDQSVTVGARKLQDLLRALPEDAALTVETTSGKMTVRAARSRFNLQTLPAADYPRMGLAQEQQQTINLPQKQFRGLLKLAEFAMAQQDIRYYLNGMLLVVDKGSLQAVATDGHRLSYASISVPGDYPRHEVILPRKTVLELQRLLRDDETPIEMRFAPNQAKFSFAGMEFVSKLVEGKFPDYNRVIPKNHKNRVTLGRSPLLQSLQRAAILTSDKFKGVRVNIEPGMLRIASSNAEQEEAMEELEIDYGGDPIEIGFNVTYLIDALANMGQEMVTVELQDTNSSALITVPDQSGFKYVVMPMRI